MSRLRPNCAKMRNPYLGAFCLRHFSNSKLCLPLKFVPLHVKHAELSDGSTAIQTVRCGLTEHVVASHGKFLNGDAPWICFKLKMIRLAHLNRFGLSLPAASRHQVFNTTADMRDRTIGHQYRLLEPQFPSCAGVSYEASPCGPKAGQFIADSRKTASYVQGMVSG